MTTRLNHLYDVQLQPSDLPDGKFKDFLDEGSPLGHIEIEVDNLDVYFKKTFRLAPLKLDVKYLFNDIVTLDDEHRIVYLPERKQDEEKRHLWEMMRDLIELESDEALEALNEATNKLTHLEGKENGLGNTDRQDG